jgi:hypothetical protein
MIIHMRKLSSNRKIPNTEWNRIKQEADIANQFFKAKTFDFFRNYIEQGISEAEYMVLNNTIKDVTEERTINETIKKKFFTPKQVQVDEVRGRYRMLTELRSFLLGKISMRDEYLKMIDSGQIIIDEDT